jgi:hypothetical protein
MTNREMKSKVMSLGNRLAARMDRHDAFIQAWATVRAPSPAYRKRLNFSAGSGVSIPSQTLFTMRQPPKKLSLSLSRPITGTGQTLPTFLMRQASPLMLSRPMSSRSTIPTTGSATVAKYLGRTWRRFLTRRPLKKIKEPPRKKESAA